jgi:hypothetical protein
MAAIGGGDVHLAADMSGVTFIDAAGSTSWSPRLTGRGKREAACRCWRRPGRCGGPWASCAWTRSCRQPRAQVAPSLPAAPPDASGPARKDQGRRGFRAAPAARSRSCFVLGPALVASHGAGVPSAGPGSLLRVAKAGFPPSWARFVARPDRALTPGGLRWLRRDLVGRGVGRHRRNWPDCELSWRPPRPPGAG